MTEETGTPEYYYNEVLGLHSFAASEGMWGSKAYKDQCWEAALEETGELAKALVSENPAELPKELADCFVTYVPLVEMYGTDVKQKIHPRSSYMSVAAFLKIANIIVQERKENAVYDLMLSLTNVFDTCKYPMNEVLKLVHASNWTKFPTVEEVKGMYGDDLDQALAGACDWIESNCEGRYKDVVGYVKQGRVIFRTDNGKGKFVKPWCYVGCEDGVEELVEGMV